jgi:hypothetical protein
LRRERLPDLTIPTPFVARNDPPLRIHHEHVGLVVGSELAGAHAIGIGDGRPAPAVPLDERATLLRRVSDVETEKRDLGVILLELCVGDRLALAGASPRGPDVHEHRPARETRQRDRLAVERGSFDRRSGRAIPVRRLWGRRSRRLRGRSSGLVLATATPGRDERPEQERDDECSHEVTVVARLATFGRVQGIARVV